MFHKILVPVDGSPLSETVIEWVTEAAADGPVDVYLLRVVPHLAPSSAFGGAVSGGSSIAELEGAATAEARHYLDDVALHLPAHVHALVRLGHPATEIVRAAKEYGVDVIAMSTHGRAGLPRFVAGSVAEEVVRIAGVPVLLIHPDHAAIEATPTAIHERRRRAAV